MELIVAPLGVVIVMILWTFKWEKKLKRALIRYLEKKACKSPVFIDSDPNS